MEKKTYNNLELDVYEEVLDNGLHMFVCPMDRNEVFAKITTLYGSSILEFKPHGKDEFIEIPKGTAHFLEHKMFAKKDGEDIMNKFQQNGASNNAFTSSHVTSYYFSAPNKFFENLENLLHLVTEPYYTDENVLKEQGIIDQEIKAGFDDPEQSAYYTTLFNTFSKLPYRYPVAGYTNSIKDITPEILYDCYNTFYHPSNMVLTITGNVDALETIKFVKEFYAKLDYKNMPQIEVKEYDEPREVFKEEEIMYKDISNYILENGYKVYLKDIDVDLLKVLQYVEMYLAIKFGSISKFNQECFEDKNILTPIRYMFDNKDDYLYIDFDTKVIEKKDIFERIYNNINDKEFSKEDFDLILKNILRATILMSENVGRMNNSIDYQFRKYGRVVYDIYDVYKSLNYEECVKVINALDFTHNTRTIVTKK
ncbi:MAG: insulinase family protein [Bacilli bacterium]|nr:insulinase family protein [Bacilli bacterium]